MPKIKQRLVGKIVKILPDKVEAVRKNTNIERCNNFSCYVFSDTGRCYEVTYNTDMFAPTLQLQHNIGPVGDGTVEYLVVRIGGTFMIRHSLFVAHLDTFYCEGRTVPREHYRCLSSFIVQSMRANYRMDSDLVLQAHLEPLAPEAEL